MKSDWKNCILGDCLQIVKTSVMPKEQTMYSCFSLPAFDNSRTPEILDGKDIKSSKFVLTENTILFNKLNPKFRRIWNVHSLDQTINPIASTEFLPLKVNSNISQDFLYYYISSPSFTALMDGIKTGTSNSQQRIDWRLFLRQPIYLPPSHTQCKIARILTLIDDKIHLNQQINKNLLQQLHILYSRLFCDSAMDTPLGEVVATTSGGTPSRKHDEYYSDSSICWVKSKELLGNYIHETEEHINDLAIKKSSAKLLPKHSVLIAMYGATVGACGVISKPMTCNQAVCALLCNENYPYTYLFQIAYESQQKFINLAVGSAQQNISQVLIKQLNLHSDLNIIQKFHGLALPMHQEIESLQAENMHLAALRDNLLPKLMSGELDVSNIDL